MVTASVDARRAYSATDTSEPVHQLRRGAVAVRDRRYRAAQTGPRLPYKPSPPRPSPRRDATVQPTGYAFTGARALAHVRSAYEKAPTDEERARVVAIMRRLVDQQLIAESDVAHYFAAHPAQPRR